MTARQRHHATACRRTRTSLRIGNASGFYGDRFSAMREMLDGGELDVLTGDYLAELTMLILGRDRMKRPGARLRQDVPAPAGGLPRHSRWSAASRIVANAGGLNPAGLADKLREARRTSSAWTPRIAHVEGDDLLPRAAELGLAGPLTANAYLGGFGIAACLRAGRRRRGHRAGHRRLAGRRAGGRALRLAARRLRRAGRRRRRRARHRVRRAGHRRQLRLLHRDRRPAPPRLPDRRDRTPTAPASSPSTPAPAARSPSGPSPRSCCTRSPGAALRRTRTSPPAWTPSS